MITGKEVNPYIADGKCEACNQWYCVVTLEERKVRNAICQKCKKHIELEYRALVISNEPLVCGFCKADPVFVERAPGSSIFVVVDGKATRHPCDLINLFH